MKKFLVLILTLAVGLALLRRKKWPESEKSFFGRFLRATSRKI